MEAAQLLGYRILVTTAGELSFTDGQPTAMCHKATLRPAVVHDGHRLADTEWYIFTIRALCTLSDADAVIMRTDPPVDAAQLSRLLTRPILTTGS